MLLRERLILLTAACVFGLCGAQTAEACGEPGPADPSEACETLHLYTPAQRFPVELSDQLRISNDSISEYGVHEHAPGGVFDVGSPFVVERDTGAGFEAVEYELVEQAGLLGGVMQIQLGSPAPGDYRVAWPLSTCDQAWVDTGAGALIGAWTMVESAPTTTDLGGLTAAFSVIELQYNLGIGADCEPITADAMVGRAELHLAFSEAFAPWADAATVAVYVDGELEHGFAAVPSAQAESGQWSTALDTLCATQSDLLGSITSIPEGTYDVQLVARVGDYDLAYSNEVSYTADCGGLGSDPPDPSEDSEAMQGDVGCSVTGEGAGGLGGLALALLLGGFVRRRVPCR